MNFDKTPYITICFTICLGLLILICPGVTKAQQIVNGSFEQDSSWIQDQKYIPSGWQGPWATVDTSRQTPDTLRGDFSLKNIHHVSEFPTPQEKELGGILFQTLDNMESGDIYRLDGWVKSNTGLTYKLKWLVLKYSEANSLDSVRVVEGDSIATNDTSWTHLSVTDTLQFEQGDSVAVALDAGFSIGGPIVWKIHGLFDGISIEKIGEATDVPSKKSFPNRLHLQPAYPNPFNPTTTIRFRLPHAMPVTLSVYNALGRHVRTLVDKSLNAGTHAVTFNGHGLSSGLYMYRLRTRNGTRSRKMLLVK